MKIELCVPVLKRYDLLGHLLDSLDRCPDAVVVHVINNGRKALQYSRIVHDVFTPNVGLSVAASWNWFLTNVPEPRVIANDDVEFAPHSLQRLASADADIAFAAGVGFSCFMIRDRCVEQIGLFDESISPGYAYYEDEDYQTRMLQSDVRYVDVDCDVVHHKSSTLEVNSDAEMQEHHRRFYIAQQNYVKKWGAMPGVIKAALMAKALT